MTRRIVVLLAGLLLVAACSSGTKSTQSTSTSASTSTAPTATAPAGPGPKITISNFQFASPQSVPPGATVTVVNSDQAEHSVTADEGKAFDVDVDGNGTATFTAPAQPGTYAYHCTYHPMMHGQLIVQ
jgi:plastocyanin